MCIDFQALIWGWKGIKNSLKYLHSLVISLSPSPLIFRIRSAIESQQSSSRSQFVFNRGISALKQFNHLMGNLHFPLDSNSSVGTEPHGWGFKQIEMKIAKCEYSAQKIIDLEYLKDSEIYETLLSHIVLHTAQKTKNKWWRGWYSSKQEKKYIVSYCQILFENVFTSLVRIRRRGEYSEQTALHSSGLKGPRSSSVKWFGKIESELRQPLVHLLCVIPLLKIRGKALKRETQEKNMIK